jgi:hypothetical protein
VKGGSQVFFAGDFFDAARFRFGLLLLVPGRGMSAVGFTRSSSANAISSLIGMRGHGRGDDSGSGPYSASISSTAERFFGCRSSSFTISAFETFMTVLKAQSMRSIGVLPCGSGIAGFVLI